MNCKKVIYKNLTSVPNIYKCWICGYIPKYPQFKSCVHQRLLTCFQCLKIQKCRQCRVGNLTYFYFLDTPEIYTIYLRNIYIHCQNCHDDIQGFKFQSHESKCYDRLKEITNFELVNKNICQGSLDYGKFDHTYTSYKESSQMNSCFYLKENIHFDEEYLIKLQKFQIKCQKCLSKLLFINSSEHKNSCPYINVKCENYLCNWIGQRDQFQNHFTNCFPLSEGKLDEQNWILYIIKQFTKMNFAKTNQEQVNNNLEFQNIFNSIQMIQFTRVQSENEDQNDEDQSEYEDESD
ncbi:hypothetical protein pb186bvf_012937 [Paramecium bursaria]